MKGSWYYPQRQLPTMGEHPSQAFSHQTRTYLRKRVWRSLKRIGELGQSEDYVRMAAGVLLAFTDDDAAEPRQEHRYRWNPETRRADYDTVHFDRYANCFALNQVLYSNSLRYQSDERDLRFHCAAGFESGGAEPENREEAFPRLWDRHPQAVLELLNKSRCEPVHHFGTKVMRAAPEFCDRLDVESLILLLQSPYEVTGRFAFELAVSRYDAAAPDLSLILALVSAAYRPAREQAFAWVRDNPAAFFQSSDFTVALVSSSQADTRAFARETLRNVSLNETTARAISGRLMASLLQLTSDDDELATDIVETLLLVFGHHLRQVEDTIIRELLNHALPVVQRFAGDLVLQHESFSSHPPDDVLQALLASDHQAVRAMAVRIISQLPDEILRDNPELLVGLTRHPQADIRDLIRPQVVRLSEADPILGERIARRLVEALLVPGAPDGVPSHTAAVLCTDLRSRLQNLEPDTVWRLLQSRSAPAQEVGGVLLATNVDASQLSMEEISRLASHEILSVRDAARDMCRAAPNRLQEDPDAMIRIADSRWEDTRRFAVEFIGQHFSEDGALSADVMIGLCDSVKPDVRQFGRQLVTQLFQSEQGEEYVVKLSEHPAPDMQLFASGFLEQHATDSPERLEQLAPYFVCVLSQVNRGRIARARACQLLETEAAKDERSARVAADILSRVCATVAVGDRATAVRILLEIQTRGPHIETPLIAKPLEVRGGV